MVTAADGHLLLAFAAVVRCGSFSAAARELELSKSVISERVKLLEQRCGARLLERTTRRLRITEAGAEVLAAAERVADALGQLSHRLDARQREPAGLLRVSTTNDLGPLLVGPAVARLVSAHPRLRVELLAEDASHDLLEAKIDVAVRLGAPKSSSFVARKLATLEEPIVAAPELADRLGPVSRPGELASAPWVRHSLVAGANMRFVGPGGAKQDIAPSFCVDTNSGSTLLSLLVHGAGVGVLPEHALREPLHAGRLVRLCPGWIWKRVALYALMPSKSARNPALAAFLVVLREQLGRDEQRWRPIA